MENEKYTQSEEAQFSGQQLAEELSDSQDKDLRQYPHNESFKDEETKRREDALLDLGVSQEAIDYYRKGNPRLVGAKVFTESVSALEKAGLPEPVSLINRAPSLMGTSAETISRNLEGLASLGLKDWRKCTESVPILISYEPETLQERIQKVEELGFDKSLVDKAPILLTQDNRDFEQRMDVLSGLGYKNVKRMVERYPQLLLVPGTAVAERLDHLGELGFSDPISLTEGNPSILANRPSKIKGKIDHLTSMGFKDPNVIYEKFPNLMSLSEDNIDRKVIDLKTMGFRSPQMLIEKWPATLAFASESVEKRLSLLQELGFLNPVHLVEKYPQVLGRNEDSIIERVRFMESWASNLRLKVSAQELMIANTNLFSSKIDKIMLIGRSIAESEDRPEEITANVINGLTIANIENLLVALHKVRKQGSYTARKLLKEAREVRKEGFDEAMRRKIITTSPYLDEAVKDIYSRSYPPTDSESIE